MVAPTMEEIRKHLDRERKEIIASQHDYDFDMVIEPEGELLPEIKEAQGEVQIGHEDDDGFVFSYEGSVNYKDASSAKLKTDSAFFDSYEEAFTWVLEKLDTFCTFE